MALCEGDKVCDHTMPGVQGVILTLGVEQSLVRWSNYSHHDLSQDQVCCNSWLVLYGEAEELPIEIEHIEHIEHKEYKPSALMAWEQYK